ncbi:MAG: UDP-2,3-diacylglucosamine diphosphatase LpxI [Candidatus Omnitrophota bacterium]
MRKIGLIAGGGDLPLEFVRSVKSHGDKIIVFALKDMALSQIEKEADKTYWMEIGQYRKFGFLLLTNRIRELVLMGKVDKKVIYKEGKYDREYSGSLKKLENKKDYSILGEITRHLRRIGVEVIDGIEYLSHLFPEKGVLSETLPDNRIEEDIAFGYEIVKKLADMDIGQTVVVKEKTIVAVEAMEGTDSTISRAGSIAGAGCVMVKVSRPRQDMRWDVPTVGPDTMRRLCENRFSAIAIENNRMFMLDRPEFIRGADENNLVVKVI